MDAAARALAAEIARGDTVSLGKRAFYEQLEMPIEDAYHFTRGVMEANVQSPSAQEQMRAFLDKRGVR